MVWNVIISPQAQEDLENLENPISQRIKEKLKEVKKNVNRGVDADHYFKWINKYEIHRLRVGKYRVFADIDKNKHRIEIITVMHRDKAYKGWG